MDFPVRYYWLPKPFCSPQSGHIQVMPLQDIPHTFSSMQLWQMAKPQRQVQQKGAVFPQNWQVRFFIRLLRFSRSRAKRDALLECGIGGQSPWKMVYRYSCKGHFNFCPACQPPPLFPESARGRTSGRDAGRPSGFVMPRKTC